MTRLYAGWAPGSALNFGWQLGVTSSDCDHRDYRAMLVREREKDDEIRRDMAAYDAKIDAEEAEHNRMLDAQDEERGRDEYA